MERLPHDVPDQTHTVVEAAHRLRVSVHTVRHMIRRGRIDATKAGGIWQIPASEIVRVLDHRPIDGHR